MGISVLPPAVASWGPNRLDIFVRGSNGNLYHKYWNGQHWGPSSGWEDLGGPIYGQPAVTSWGLNRLDIVTQGTDQRMYHKYWNGQHWGPSSGWDNLGGPFHTFNGQPAVTSWGPNRLDIVAVGTDNVMYHKAWDGANWQPSPIDWLPLGGLFTSPPAMVSRGSNLLDIFAMGTDNPPQMYHKAWESANWQPSAIDWEPLGSVTGDPIDGKPAVASWAPDRLDIVAVSDNWPYHKAWDHGNWQTYPIDEFNKADFEGLRTPPGATGQPAVASWGPNRLDIFAVGPDDADNQMFHTYWNGPHGWGPNNEWEFYENPLGPPNIPILVEEPTQWESLGEDFDSPPAVVSWGPNRLDVFAWSDGEVNHKYWNGQRWGPSSGWESLGGPP